MLAHYAALLERRADDLRLVRGQYADVVIDQEAGSAWRFPRYEVELRELAAHARRLEQVAELRLPVATPRVLSVRAAAPGGEAYVETALIAGTPLAQVGRLGARSRRRLAAQLADVLLALRTVDASALGLDRSDGHAQWADLETRARAALLDRMSAAGRERAAAQLRRAAEVARHAPVSFIHGDLGATNVLVDAARGTVTGIVDWDSARLDDPAIDVASLTAALDLEVHQQMLRAAPMLRDDLARADAYRATFALQEALFGVERGVQSAIARGLAGYRT